MEGNLPTGSLREENIIRMFSWYSLDELDASKVFPMSHGLLEKCLVSSGKVTIDLVRYNTMIPDTFLSCSRGSSISRWEIVD